MKERRLVMGRVINIVCFIYAVTMAVLCLSMLFANTVPAFFPWYAVYTIPTVHIIVSIIIFILIFKENMIIKFLLFQIESWVAIYTGFEEIGMFLFYASIFTLYLFYFTDKKDFKHVIICFLFHLFFLIINPATNIATKVVNIASSIFMMIMFMYFYEVLKNKFSSFIPKAVTLNSNISDKVPGDTIKLSEYNLTERQISFVYDNIIENLTYNDLVEKYFVSLSTVKKEFADVYKIFGVTKLSELQILLLQYKIEK